MKKSTILRNLLNSGETLVMPDAYDPISARIIERAGFKAVQCSGGSFAFAACYPSEVDVNIAENVRITRMIADAVDVPVMANGEDGYGDLNVVPDTVSRFIRAGAAGVNIEDLVPVRDRTYEIVDASYMAEKIVATRKRAAAEGDPDFIINARTDALRAFDSREDGLKEAIERANLYIEAGADLAFICYAATLDEVKTLVKEVHGQISIAAGMPYNIKAFSIDDLRELGVARVSLPMTAILTAINAMSKVMSMISEPDGFAKIVDEGFYCPPEELSALLSR